MNKDKQYLSVVNGNDFTLNMHVTRWNADNQSFIDYRMDNCSQVVCFLVAVTGGRRYKLPVTIDGNILTAEIDGSMLNVGVYGLELLFEDAESKSKRSYEPALLKIVRTNAEATYSQADFDSEDDCRLHITVQTNASFITIGAPTADTEISATSYNAVSNAAVADAINNLQTQIDSIGSEILDPASVYTKDETEALVDAMIDPQELEDYVANAVSYYTTTEQFDSSYNSLSERISAIEDNPVDLSSYVSQEELNAAAYLQSSALDGLATQAYVEEKVSAIDVTDQLTDYVRKEDLNSAGYLQADALEGMASESYVVDKINAIAPTDISGLVSYEFLSSQSYLQADDLSQYATQDFVSQQIEAIPAPDLSGYATQEFVSQQIAAIPQPDLSSYITETALDAALSSYAQLADLISNERVVSTALNSLADRIETVEGDYVSATELDAAAYLQADDLNDFATKSYVDEKISGITPTDLSAYVSKDELNAAAYLQADDLNDFATKSYVDEKISGITPTDLSAYVSKEELNSAAYLQADDISDVVRDSDLVNAGYVTTTALDTALSSYAKVSDIEDNEQVISTALNTLSDRIGLIENDYVSDDDLSDFATKSYVDDKISGITPTDLSAYVSKEELNAAAYLQADDLTDYATKSYVDDKISGIAPTDLSAYVSKEELNAAAYLQADDISDVVRDSDLANAGYITANDVSSMGYATTQYVTEQVAADLSSYVSKSELNAASYLQADDLNDYATKSYVEGKIADIPDPDLSSYVSKSELNAASYLQADDLNDYVTNTALNTTLSSYTTKADVPYKFVVMSYSDYTALTTKDPQTFYFIPEE